MDNLDKMMLEDDFGVRPRVIIIPVDNSIYTSRTIDWYVENLMKPNDLVHMINIVEPIYNVSSVGLAMEAAMSTVSEELEKKINKQVEQGKKLVKKYIHDLRNRGGKGKGYIRLDSKVGEAIIKVCQEHKADMIIVSNRGEGLIRRTFLGSVSDYVLHHADRPVIIVPPHPDIIR